MLLLHWLVVFAGLSGLGTLLLPQDRDSPYDLFDAFWAGVFLASGLLLLIHLWSPIRPVFALGLVVAGIAAGLTRAPLSRARFPAAAVLMFAAFAWWASMASLNEPPQADVGFYHLPSVRWAQAYAAVPGLANLNWPLGHPSSFVLLTAAFDDSRATWVQSYHIMGGLFVLALAMEGCVALAGTFSGVELTPSRVIRAFGLVVAAMLIGNWLPTLGPDVAVVVVGYVTASRLAALLLDSPPPSRARPLAVLFTLAGLGLTLKLTSSVYFGAVAMVSFVTAPAAARTARSLLTISILAAVFVGAWIARSAILSGYPFYPATVLPLHTAWTVPAAVVRAHVVETLWHTRGVGTPTRHWVLFWLRSVVWTAGKTQVLMPIGLGASALLIMAVRGRVRFGRQVAMFMLPAVAGSAAWFVGAPEPRFAGAMFWHAGIGTVALALTDPAICGAVRARAMTTAAVTGMIAIYVVAGSRSRNAVPPWAPAVVPASPQLARLTTASGLVVYKPVADGRCLDAPLPCTLEVDPTLALRKPGDLGSGFIVAADVR